MTFRLVKGIWLRYEDHLMLEIDLGAVAHRAMWGYGVDPPADINPYLVSGRVCQPDLAGTAAGWAITTRWIWLAPS